MNLNYAMMTVCAREGIAGNCGLNCEGFRSFKCDHFHQVYLDGEPMKQEILCPNCAAEMKKIIGKGHKGEYTKFLSGRAKMPFTCDFGGCHIGALAPCVAFSIWTDDRPMLNGWEHQYIVAREDP